VPEPKNGCAGEGQQQFTAMLCCAVLCYAMLFSRMVRGQSQLVAGHEHGSRRFFIVRSRDAASSEDMN
jgi:hypothetical protein